MVHHVAADLVVLVPEASRLHVVRREEGARVVEPAQREHELLRANHEAVAVERRHGKRFDLSCGGVRLDADDVRVQQQRDLLTGGQLVEPPPEGLGIGVAEDRALVAAELGEWRRERRTPGAAATGRRIESGAALRSLVVRLEVLERDRSSAFRDPATLLKVVRFERSSAPTTVRLPLQRGTAEQA